MSLEQRKRGDRTYYYFEYSLDGRRRYLYLGSPSHPKVENIIQARGYIEDQLHHYNVLDDQLNNLLRSAKGDMVRPTTEDETSIQRKIEVEQQEPPPILAQIYNSTLSNDQIDEMLRVLKSKKHKSKRS